jgi:hypothetical protein
MITRFVSVVNEDPVSLDINSAELGRPRTAHDCWPYQMNEKRDERLIPRDKIHFLVR